MSIHGTYARLGEFTATTSQHRNATRYTIRHEPTDYVLMDQGLKRAELTADQMLRKVLAAAAQTHPVENLSSYPQSVQDQFPAMIQRAVAVYEAARRALHIPVLDPALEPSERNMESAARAYADLAAGDWTPLDGYPGSKNPWRVRCDLCGWEGIRRLAQLHGQGSAPRHPGCLAPDKHAARRSALSRLSAVATPAPPSIAVLILPPDGVIELDPQDNAHPCAWSGAAAADGSRLDSHRSEWLVPDPHNDGVHVPVCRRHLGDLLRP